MKKLRWWVFPLGILALVVLFFKMPSLGSFLGCRACSLESPWLPLLGAAYFSVLIGVAVFFPSFPGSLWARSGLIWAVLLFVAMTWRKFPGLCWNCLIAHLCHILIWVIWLIAPPLLTVWDRLPARHRIYLVLLAPISVVALFAALNLLAYNPKQVSLRPGDLTPKFRLETVAGVLVTPQEVKVKKTVLHFVIPDCPFCEQQMETLSHSPYRVIHVTPVLSTNFDRELEWVEDKEGELRKLFKVSGFPTLVALGEDGKIADIRFGIPINGGRAPDVLVP